MMRMRWNTLRHSAITLLGALALLLVCVGLHPMAVQAEEPEFYVYIGEDDFLPYEVFDEETGDSWYEYSLKLGEGTATLDSDSHTLTLDNITLEGSDSGIVARDDLTIVLEGSNSITIDEYGAAISGGNNLTIQGDGSLNIYGKSGNGIMAGSITIENNANVTIEGNGDVYPSFYAIAAQSNLKIQDSCVKIDTDYGIQAVGNNAFVSIIDSTVEVTVLPDKVDGRYYGMAIRACDDISQSSYENNHPAKNITISGKSQVIADGGIYANLEIDPPTNGVIRIAASLDPDGDQEELSGDDYPFTTTQNFDVTVGLFRCAYIEIWAETEDDEEPAVSGGTQKVEDTGRPCNHRYEWETYKAATATTDGVMRYRCVKCGTVEYEVPTAAYYIYNKDAQESIQKAAQGATVTVETPIFVSFHEMVKDALVARPDVTLVVDYKYQGKSYEMTIPAGSGETLTTLFGDSQFAGFRYLGGAFATVEK